jgi:hypothetical protein
MVTIRTTCFHFTNFAFFSHNVSGSSHVSFPTLYKPLRSHYKANLSVLLLDLTTFYSEKHTKCKTGLAMPQVVSRRPVTAEARVQSLVSTCGICGAQSGTMTGFSPSTSVFPCHYHSTNAPYSFIHLPPTLYNVSLPVLQFSPVSIIPPMLHTHSPTTDAV